VQLLNQVLQRGTSSIVVPPRQHQQPTLETQQSQVSCSSDEESDCISVADSFQSNCSKITNTITTDGDSYKDISTSNKSSLIIDDDDDTPKQNQTMDDAIKTTDSSTNTANIFQQVNGVIILKNNESSIDSKKKKYIASSSRDLLKTWIRKGKEKKQDVMERIKEKKMTTTTTTCRNDDVVDITDDNDANINIFANANDVKRKKSKLDLASKLKKSLERKQPTIAAKDYGMMASTASFSEEVTRDLIDHFGSGGITSGDDDKENQSKPSTSSDNVAINELSDDKSIPDTTITPTTSTLEECDEMYSMKSFSKDAMKDLSAHYHSQDRTNTKTSPIINRVDDDSINGNGNFILEKEDESDEMMMSTASFTMDYEDKITMKTVYTSHNDVDGMTDTNTAQVKTDTTKLSSNSMHVTKKEKSLAATAVKSKCLQIDFSRLSSSGSGDLFLEEGSIADLFSSSFTKCGSMHCNIIEELNNSSAAGILMTSSGYCSYHSVSGNGQALAV